MLGKQDEIELLKDKRRAELLIIRARSEGRISRIVDMIDRMKIDINKRKEVEEALLDTDPLRIREYEQTVEFLTTWLHQGYSEEHQVGFYNSDAQQVLELSRKRLQTAQLPKHDALLQNIDFQNDILRCQKVLVKYQDLFNECNHLLSEQEQKTDCHQLQNKETEPATIEIKKITEADEFPLLKAKRDDEAIDSSIFDTKSIRPLSNTNMIQIDSKLKKTQNFLSEQPNSSERSDSDQQSIQSVCHIYSQEFETNKVKNLRKCMYWKFYANMDRFICIYLTHTKLYRKSRKSIINPTQLAEIIIYCVKKYYCTAKQMIEEHRKQMNDELRVQAAQYDCSSVSSPEVLKAKYRNSIAEWTFEFLATWHLFDQLTHEEQRQRLWESVRDFIEVQANFFDSSVEDFEKEKLWQILELVNDSRFVVKSDRSDDSGIDIQQDEYNWCRHLSEDVCKDLRLICGLFVIYDSKSSFSESGQFCFYLDRDYLQNQYAEQIATSIRLALQDRKNKNI